MFIYIEPYADHVERRYMEWNTHQTCVNFIINSIRFDWIGLSIDDHRFGLIAGSERAIYMVATFVVPFQGENVSMCQLSFSCLPKTANKFQVCATIAN